MEIRITFRSEVYVSGETLAECKKQWEDMPLFSADALENHADFVEVCSIEDADTHDDLEDEWDHDGDDEEQDDEREDIRHKISAILMDTDEQHPKKCNIVIDDEEACGLSTLDMAHIDECFQEPSEGIIWFHFEGHYKNNDTMEKEWTDFDDLDLSTLKVILEYLQENQ